VKNGKTAL